MIKVIAKNRLREGQREVFTELAGPLIEASQQEAGCLSYDLYEELSDPGVLTFIEEWADEEAIRLHKESEHYTRIIPQLKELVHGKEVNLYRKID